MMHDLLHLSPFRLAVIIEDYVHFRINQELGNVAVQVVAAKSVKQCIWQIWCKVRDRTYGCEIPDHMKDWLPFESMITQIKLTI
jgi:hypothetical protein